jgi:ABC-2 type transport system permease protein
VIRTDVWGFRNPVGLWTLVKRELFRTYKVINQVIWPPIITTILYVLVFGLGLGSRVQNVQGVSYAAFLIPGLIMLQVIDQTYGESSSSLFQGRFMNSIQELLVAPLSAVEMVTGFVLAAVLRALLIAFLILGVGYVMVHTLPRDWALYFAMTVFVGGVFTSAQFLPPFVRQVSLFNPMFYMIDAFRYSFTGRSDVSVPISVAIVTALTAAALGTALRMTALGVKLRM